MLQCPALSLVTSLDFADYNPEKLFFRRTEIEDFETKYRKYLPTYASLFSDNDNAKTKSKKTSPITNADKKLRPSQKAKIKCREIAQKLWNKDPSITIADMIVSDNINSACVEIAGKTFAG